MIDGVTEPYAASVRSRFFLNRAGDCRFWTSIDGYRSKFHCFEASPRRQKMILLKTILCRASSPNAPVNLNTYPWLRLETGQPTGRELPF
jgi:hypothetical protein